MIISILEKMILLIIYISAILFHLKPYNILKIRRLMMTFKTITLGCKVNSYESEALKEQLLAAGFKYSDEEKADIYIINTCAVTQVAEKKDMMKIRSLAKNYPDSEIVVMGCFAQLHPEKIRDIKQVKILTGTSNRSMITSNLIKQNNLILREENSRKFSYEEQEISKFSSEVRPFVKIQDGCDNFCSYCIVPLTRGKSRSRKKENILNEISNLAKNGFKEIVITGIDTGSFNNGPDYTFSDLIEDILNIEPKTFRVRISSLEFSEVDEKLINILKNNKRLVPHLHLPLQSGCERICHLMNRKYDTDGFKKLVLRLEKEVDNFAVSTDVIVGFPSETEEDFMETYNFIKDVNFMRLHVFPYSRRPLTKAYYMKDQVDRSIAKDRARRLISLGEELANKYLDKFVGKTLNLLVEEKLEDKNGGHIYRGYTENYLDLKVFSKEHLYGKLLKVVVDKNLITKYEIIS